MSRVRSQLTEAIRLATSPVGLRRVALLTTAALALLVLSGAAVRLSGSGLGCPTWPDCTGKSITGGSGLHHAVELGNRIFTIALFVAVAASVVVSWAVRPVRPDLRRPAAGLLAGYLGQAVLGGITVLTRLNPLAVASHFLLSMVLLWVGLVFVQRTSEPPGVPHRRVLAPVRQLTRLLTLSAGVVLVVGTLVTGSGPHAGARVDNRLPFPLRDITQLHADLVLFFAGATVATWFALRATGAPADLQRRSRWLVFALLAQIVVGYTQYFLGLPAGLVEVHVLGATVVWMLTLSLHLATQTRQEHRDVPAALRQENEPDLVVNSTL